MEEQRALATIGRTWFVHSDDVTNKDELEDCLLESQKAYLKSLAVCDKLRGTVSEKELLEMRSRLYLNLGHTYDAQKDSSRVKSFMEKALIIARYRLTVCCIIQNEYCLIQNVFFCKDDFHLLYFDQVSVNINLYF